jgi:hypothetical protein
MMRIKYLLFAIFITCIAGVPVSGQASRQYDEEIDRIIGKIHQYPDRTKDLGKLKENFDQANKFDHDRINDLLKTGQPDIWLEIYKSYMSLESRQLRVQEIPEKSVQLAGIEIVDYQKELKEAKYRATAYHYALGQKLLASESQEDARNAYVEFMKVAMLNDSFNDLDKLLRKAILKGATNVEFELDNRTGKNISSSLADQLSIIIWQFKKAKYGQVEPATKDESFSFILRVVLDEMKIGPDKVKELQYSEERDVYRSGIVVDTISCLINETRQLKRASLTGSLEYVDKQTGQVVNRVPIKVESVFKNAYATLQGNPAAAGDETRALLLSKQAAYPSSEQMILDAAAEFAKKAGEIIVAE